MRPSRLAFVSLGLGLCLALAPPGAARAQERRRRDPDEILLKSGKFVPPAAKRFSSPPPTRARHLIVQLEDGRTQAGLAQLRASGIRVLEWVPRNAVSAFVPADVEPTMLPFVRWAAPLRETDKIDARVARRSGRLHVLVDFFPDVPRHAALDVVAASGGRVIPRRRLRLSSLFVEIDAARLSALTAHDEVSFVYLASQAIERNLPFHVCAGAVTEGGVVANYALDDEGWDGPGLGSAALRYFFVNGTPDVVGEEAEVVRALQTWSQWAAITWTPASGASQTRSVDVRWAAGAHGDLQPFDGPGQVLAHTFYPVPDNLEPLAGDMHFDEDETWRIGTDVDVFSVALHEAGHALGLSHSSDPNSVMYPYYGGIVNGLAGDDICAIRSIYASSGETSSDCFEPDDSPAQAHGVGPTTTETHSIFPIGDVDYYTFTLTEPSDVTLTTSGLVGDTRMTLYDANGVEIASDEDSGPGLFASIERTRAAGGSLARGSYLVRVEESGNDAEIDGYDFAIDARRVPLDAFEPDDTMQQARLLQPGTTQTHSIVPVGDVDYLEFQLSSLAEVTIATSGAAGDTRMTLYDASGAAIESNDNSGSSLFSRIERSLALGGPLRAGTYFISVEEAGNDDEIAAYDVALDTNYLPTSDSFEPDDTMEQAAPLFVPDVSYPVLVGGQHTITPATDVDYSVFTLRQLSEVRIETLGAHGPDGTWGATEMWLLAADGSTLEYSATSIDRTRANRDWLEPGTYFVRVTEQGQDAELAGYELRISISPVPFGGDDGYEENDSREQATLFTPSMHVGGFQWDDDWFRIDVGRLYSRVILTWSVPPGGSPLGAQFLDAMGTILAVSEKPYQYETIDVVVPHSGTYFLRVYGPSQGDGYGFWLLERGPAVPPYEPPPNDDFANAIKIWGSVSLFEADNLGATAEAGEPNHAGKAGGSSAWWTWTAPLSSTVEISTEPSFDTVLAVYTGSRVDDLTLVAENDDVPDAVSSKVVFHATAGTAYAIALDGAGGAQGITRVLLNQRDPPPPPPPPPPIALSWSSVATRCKTKASAQACKLKAALVAQNLSSSASAPASVTVYLSNDAVQDASDRAIGFAGVPALSVGKAKKLKLKSTLPAGTTPSGKFLIAVIVSGPASQTVVYGPMF